MSDQGQPIKQKRLEPLDEVEEADRYLEEGGEDWLISYADLMTLLFGLFAMMFSFAKFDDTTTVRVERALLKYFGGPYIHETKFQNPSQEVANQFKHRIDRTPLAKDLELKMVGEEIEITFVTASLFPMGSAALVPETIKPLEFLIDLLHGKAREYVIRVEGHTDDNPISTGTFPSNWELSSARAASIVRFFEQRGYNPSRLEAVGFGSAQPAYPNRNEKGEVIAENQMRNRRVVIKVIPYVPRKDESVGPETPKGLEAAKALTPLSASDAQNRVPSAQPSGAPEAFPEQLDVPPDGQSQ